MPYIDVKITTWERYNFDASTNIVEIIDTIKKEGESFYPYELSDIDGFVEYEKIYEADSYITVEENSGNSTIEVYNDEGKLLYQNGEVD